MELREIPILKLLPQRPPFVLVDRLVDFSPLHTTTEFLIREECIFVEAGELTFKGMIENMAQTCATRIGYVNYIQGKDIEVGYIGAVRNMTFERLPRVGETITTSIKVKEDVFQMTLVDAEIRIGEEVISRAEMKIAIKKNE